MRAHRPRRFGTTTSSRPPDASTRQTSRSSAAGSLVISSACTRITRSTAESGSGATASIDAPEAAPIEAALKATGWKLTDILVTHHHADHTGGILALKEKYKCRVVAPAAEAETIPAVDLTVREGDRVGMGKLSGSVIETPGHTNGHVTYWFHADKLAFVGDTLF